MVRISVFVMVLMMGFYLMVPATMAAEVPDGRLMVRCPDGSPIPPAQGVLTYDSNDNKLVLSLEFYPFVTDPQGDVMVNGDLFITCQNGMSQNHEVDGTITFFGWNLETELSPAFPSTGIPENAGCVNPHIDNLFLNLSNGISYLCEVGLFPLIAPSTP
jgi:hypothetical protein